MGELTRMDQRMIPVYTRRILDGKIEIEQVPEHLKDYVLDELRKESEDDEDSDW